MSQQPGGDDRLRVFVSYSRRDLDIVDPIVAALDFGGINPLIDRRDLPYGEKWQEQLDELIRSADTVMWLISPDSIASKWCHWELGAVGRSSKRLVPVRIRSFDLAALPEALGRIQIFPSDDVFTLKRDLQALVQTLNADQAWLKEGTRLYDRAREWIANQRGSALLLRGAALSAADAWSRKRPHAAPSPANEVLELLLASRRGQSRRQRWTVAGSLTIALTASALSGIALLSRQRAKESEGKAVASEGRAMANAELAAKNEKQAIEQRDRALVAQSRFLTVDARRAADRFDYGEAIARSLEALPQKLSERTRPFLSEAALGLREILQRYPLKAVLRGHSTSLRSAAFSPDGARIVTGASDGARVWEVRTGKEIARLDDSSMGQLGGGTIYSTAYSPDGRKVLTASWLGRTWIWDGDNYKLLTTLIGHNGRILHASFSRGGDRVLTASENGAVRIWNANNGAQLVKVELKGRTVTSAAFAPDGRYFATASSMKIAGSHIVAPKTDRGAAQIWNAFNGAEVARIDSKSGACDEVLFSPDGRLLAVNEGADVVIWDIEKKTAVRRLSGHDDSINGMAFSDKQNYLATSSRQTTRLWSTSNWDFRFAYDGGGAVFAPGEGSRLVTVDGAEAAIQDTETGKELQRLKGHELLVLQAIYSRDGRRIATLSDDNTARIWNSEGGVIYDAFNVSSPFGEPQTTVSSLQYIDHARKLVTRSSLGNRLWLTDDGRPVMFLRDKPFARAMAFSIDASTVYSPDYDGALVGYDTSSGEDRGRFPGKGNAIQIQGAATSSDGERLATWYSDRSVRLWDATRRELLTEINDGVKAVVGTGFLPDGKFYVVYVDGTVRVSDRSGVGKVTLSRADHDLVSVFAISGNGRRIIERIADNKVEIREIGSSRAPIVKNVGENFMTAIAFSPDGSLAVFGANDGKVRVVQADSGEDLSTVEAARGSVGALQFMPDGKSLIVGTSDGAAYIWDIGARRVTIVLRRHETAISAVAVADDGSHVATATEGGIVRIWRLLPNDQALIDLGKTVASQCLAPAVRQELGLDSDETPRWCITGPGLEEENDPALWRPLPPYQSEQWRKWLAGKKMNANPPMPSPENRNTPLSVVE